MILDEARLAARSVLEAPLKDERSRVDFVYRLALGRLPSERERDLALAYLAAPEQMRLQHWERFVQTLFACLDFRYAN